MATVQACVCFDDTAKLRLWGREDEFKREIGR